MTNTEDFDPFDSASSPAVSFRDAPKGTKKTLKVKGRAELVQQRDFDTNEPEFWPPNAGETQGAPKMAAVLTVEEDGERRSLWAPKSKKAGSLYMAVADAQREASERAGTKVRCDNGGTLVVELYDTEPATDKKKSDRKLYRAHYTPPEAGDAFDGGSASNSTPEEPPF